MCGDGQVRCHLSVVLIPEVSDSTILPLDGGVVFRIRESDCVLSHGQCQQCRVRRNKRLSKEKSHGDHIHCGIPQRAPEALELSVGL